MHVSSRVAATIQRIRNGLVLLKEVAEWTSKGHPDLPDRLIDVSKSFKSLFLHSGDTLDIAEALSYQQKAVDLTPGGSVELPSRLGDLGALFHLRFQWHPLPSDLDAAIQLQQKAVNLTPCTDAALPARLNNLGDAFYTRTCYPEAFEDLDNSILCFERAATSTVGPPQPRLEGATKWARYLNRHYSQSGRILVAFEKALQLIWLKAGLDKTLEGRFSQLQRTAHIAREAAAIACRLRKPAKAVELLEQCRCIVWNQVNSLHTPLDHLPLPDDTSTKTLADVLENLSTVTAFRIPSPSVSRVSSQDSNNTHSRHSTLTQRWKKLLTTIRYTPGLESFLLPLTSTALMKHASSLGTIIIVNVYEDRCDALTLIPGHDYPVHIPLPEFNSQKASEYGQILAVELYNQNLRLRRGEEASEDGLKFAPRAAGPYPSKRSQAAKGVHGVLGNLWTGIVKPIFTKLGLLVSWGVAREWK